MRTRRGNSASETKGKKSECSSNSSPDLDSANPKLGHTSPSVASSGSSSSNEKESDKNCLQISDNKSRKRRSGELEGTAKKSRSDSDSMLDSSEASGNEDLGNEADSDDNNQDDLSASSQPSTPSDLDNEFKKDYIKPEPVPPSPLAGLPHPLPRPATAAAAVTAATITTTTTTTTSACSTASVVTPVPSSQDSNNPLSFSRFPPYAGGPNVPGVLPVGAPFGDFKPPLGLYPHLPGLPPRLAPETLSVSQAEGGVGPAVLSVSSLVAQQPGGVTTQPPLSTTSFSAASLSQSAATAASTSSSTMTSMSSTGVTLMSSGVGGSSMEGEKEKKYTPPGPPLSQQAPQPLPPTMYAPYANHPYYFNLGPPRLGVPPPPLVPTLVPIKKEPGEPDSRDKEPSDQPHTVHRPLPSMAASATTQLNIPNPSVDQKLTSPHMPVPPPLTSIDSAMPSGLVDRGERHMVPDGLRDNSREAILRESRETLMGGGGGPGDMPPRSMYPPPLTTLPPSATMTSSTLPPALSNMPPHHLPPLTLTERSRMENHPSDAARQDIVYKVGAPPSLRPQGPQIKVEDGGIIDEDSDSDREGSTTPGPVPTPCNKEVFRSASACFMKVLDRGDRNCCSRCDLVFKPTPNSPWLKKKEERARKHAASTSTSSSSSSSVRDEKPRERRTETPPKSASADSGHSSSTTPSQHPLYPERHTPRPYPDTPALRQLSEYARPHAMGQDQRAAYLGLAGPPHIDPLAGYRHIAMYPPGSRERLELELERDKRERDARERELRERELREMELREKMKVDMELKPPGLERLLPPGANPLDPHWLELQRRFAYPPGAGLAVLPPGAPGAPGSAAGNHLPGVYPPVSLAGELAAREREKLERLDVQQLEQMSTQFIYQYYTQRGLSNDQLVYMQRVTNELYLRSKPDSRMLDPSQLIYQFSRADPMAGLAGNSGNPPSLASLHPGSQPPLIPGATTREQAEMIQRELYSRAYMDPALAHQLQQAQVAQHEALQRHLALERERYGPASHLPH